MSEEKRTAPQGARREMPKRIQLTAGYAEADQDSTPERFYGNDVDGESVMIEASTGEPLLASQDYENYSSYIKIRPGLAAELVKRWNAHESMKAALESAKRVILQAPYVVPYRDEVVEEISGALNAARGGKP